MSYRGVCLALVMCTGCANSSPPAPAAPPMRHAAAHRRAHRAAVARPRSIRLVYSTARNDAVQTQPAAGTCHSIGSGVYERPDPLCTPGALNPAVTQATIHKTICVDGWTATVRPPENITEQEKAASLSSYGDIGSLADYEYDHFVPLELGGATNDPRNLWPEPGASPNPKDAVEDTLREEVCDGQISLAQAQQEIVSNWTALTARAPRPQQPSRSGSSGSSGRCTVTAAYNSRYHDYDVYVRSNQPDETVSVTDSVGDSATWHTDGTGYADVYLHASRSATGGRLIARLGTAICYGRL